MPKTTFIMVSIEENDSFTLADPDTGTTKSIPCSKLIGKQFFTTSSIERFFLKNFPEKSECLCSPEAKLRIEILADWNSDYE